MTLARRSTRGTLGALVLLLVLGMVPVAPALAQDATPTAGPGTESTPSASQAAPVETDACVEPEASAPPLPEDALSIPEEFRIQLFEGVWGGIRDFYVDPDVKGLDWEAIGDEYALQIIGTDNAYEVYELLTEMVGLLEDPFTYFVSPEDLGDPASVDPTYGGIGALLDTSTAGADSDGLRILYVFEAGSAREAGIRPRDRIIAVNGDPCARIADIRGPEGTEVSLTVVSPGEEPRDIVVERRRIDPLILPEARRLAQDDGIAYLRIPSLAGQEVIDAITEDLTAFSEENQALEGLVIDLRSTNQGAPGVILEVLGHFVEGEVGAFHSRVGDEPIEVEATALAPAYADIPLVVLVDGDSEAEAEQLAAILQDQGRATVVGQQTAGETHGANSVPFPDGSILQIVAFGFKLPSGSTLEGQGVTPDVVVDEDWLSFPEEEDPGLQAAAEAIRAAASTPVDDDAGESAEPAASAEAAASAEPAASAEAAASAEPAG